MPPRKPPPPAPHLLRLTSDSMRDVSLAWAEPYVAWHEQRRYLQRGDELYRLLACIATQMRDATFVAVPTDLGFAALALATDAQERGNRVLALDSEDKLPPRSATAAPVEEEEQRGRDVRDVRAVTCMKKPDGPMDASEIAATVVKAGASLLLLDTAPHDGVLERRVVAELAAAGYRGLLVLDDIQLNDAMKAAWAAIVAEAASPACATRRAIDVTDHAHWSGTGVVAFDTTHIDVLYEPRIPVSGWTLDGKML
jgi:hypothetical protein